MVEYLNAGEKIKDLNIDSAFQLFWVINPIIIFQPNLSHKSQNETYRRVRVWVAHLFSFFFFLLQAGSLTKLRKAELESCSHPYNSSCASPPLHGFTEDFLALDTLLKHDTMVVVVAVEGGQRYMRETRGELLQLKPFQHFSSLNNFLK